MVYSMLRAELSDEMVEEERGEREVGVVYVCVSFSNQFPFTVLYGGGMSEGV